MTLRIIRSSDVIRVERLNVCVYSPPGLGKTTLGFTTEEPLLLDFDLGAHRSANRKDSVRVASWEDVTAIKEVDLAPYKTVVVDTVGRALDVLTADIIRRNPKAGRGGALTLQGYGTLKAEFVAWLKALNAYGKDVVMLTHMDEQRNGDEIIERLDVQGGSKGEIYKAADAMGRLSIRDGQRILNFSPTDAAFGKNPGQLDPLPIPHPDKDPAFLAGVIASIKTRLNAMTAEQTAAANLVEEWRTTVIALKTLQAFNDTLPAIKDQPRAVKALLSTAAAVAGFMFDKDTAKFVAGPRAAAAETKDAPKAAPTYGDVITPDEADQRADAGEPEQPGESQPVEQTALL